MPAVLRLALRHRGSLGWTPAQLGSALVGWYSAPAITGKNDGDSISQWDDLTGNGHHLLQVVGTRQPTYKTNIQNGKSIVRFTKAVAGNMVASFTLAQPHSIAMALKYRTVADTDSAWDGNGFNTAVLFVHTTVWAMYAGTVLDSTVTADTTFRAFIGVYNGASSIISIDGVESTGAGGSASPDGLQVGARGGGGVANNADVDVGEICHINRVLTPTERFFLRAYFKAQWSTP